MNQENFKLTTPSPVVSWSGMKTQFQCFKVNLVSFSFLLEPWGERDGTTIAVGIVTWRDNSAPHPPKNKEKEKEKQKELGLKRKVSDR